MTHRLFALLRTLVFGGLFIALWFWWVPRWLVGAQAYENPRPAGWIVLGAGMLIVVACAWNFAWYGRGTPAPFDPPRRLVVTGPYRWVRNPMYLGAGIALIGEALTFPRLTTAMLIMVVALWIAVTAFVMLYEEPTLRRMFGDDYVEYCRNVRRWIPRLSPWYAPAHLD